MLHVCVRVCVCVCLCAAQISRVSSELGSAYKTVHFLEGVWGNPWGEEE